MVRTAVLATTALNVFSKARASRPAAEAREDRGRGVQADVSVVGDAPGHEFHFGANGACGDGYRARM
jgi:hypothetical protein